MISTRSSIAPTILVIPISVDETISMIQELQKLDEDAAEMVVLTKDSEHAFDGQAYLTINYRFVTDV